MSNIVDYIKNSAFKNCVTTITTQLFKNIRSNFSGPKNFYNELFSFITINSNNLDNKIIIPYGSKLNTFVHPINEIYKIKNICNPPVLFEKQNEVFEKIKETRAKKNKYVTLNLPCGFGKTVLASYLIAAEKKKTVIVLKNKMLAKQWEPVIEKLNIPFLTSYCGAKKLLLELKIEDNNDVLIIIDKHLTNPEFVKYIYKKYSLFIFDEFHEYNLLNDNFMNRFLTFYPPKFAYFLTATPRKWNSYFFSSDMINYYKECGLEKKLYDIKFPVLEITKDPSLISISYNQRSKANINKLIYMDRERNDTIINLARSIYETSRLLIVVNLRDHMNLFYDRLKDLGNVIMGDAKNNQTFENINNIKIKENFIIISTVQYFGSGIDIPSLNTVFYTPINFTNSEVIQISGRILRIHDDSLRSAYTFSFTTIPRFLPLILRSNERIKFILLEQGFEYNNVDVEDLLNKENNIT